MLSGFSYFTLESLQQERLTGVSIPVEFEYVAQTTIFQG